MTGEKNGPDDERPAESRGTEVSETGPLADGGPPDSRLFRAFPDPLLCYDDGASTTVVRAVNPAFERTFDIDGRAIVGEAVADHLLVDAVAVDVDSDDGDARAEASVADAGPGTPETTGEEVLSRFGENERVTLATRRGTDGDPRHYRLEAVPVSDDGALNCVVYTDVSELRRRALDLERRAERLERFIDVAAHDLRNPLDVAKIRLEAARETDDEVHLEKIETALERIQHIVQEVLSVGGATVEQSEGVSLDTVAQAAWSTVDTASATLVVEEDLSTVEADPDLLQQIFENLFRNAVEHGGRDVTVTVGSRPDGFYLTDDGSGLSAEDRELAFEPGYSTADDNTGLGLAIVRQIAEEHEWTVTLTSGDDGGARFAFTGVGDTGTG